MIYLLILLWVSPGIGLFITASSYEFKRKQLSIASICYTTLISIVPIYNIVIWKRMIKIIEHRKGKH